MIAAASTAVVAVAVVVGVTHTSGWPRVRQRFFSGTEIAAAWPAARHGMAVNLELFAACGLAAGALGLLVALLRTLAGPVFLPVRLLAAVYTDLFRGLPVILVVYLVGFGVPALRLRGFPSDPRVLGGAALVLTYTAYVAEVFRAGIESVHPSQVAAARSLGLSHAQTMRRVVLPQAVRRVAPALLNDAISLQKDSSLVSVLGVVDAVRAAQIATSAHFNYSPYVLAGLMFLAITVPLTRVTDHLAVRAARRRGDRRAGGGP
ncbi:amino acid ABC transporter permease [Frankia sp. AgB32]|uniref:amino acid ABC transporter permease n=1 Tax=Frankia sp. AgB32 TaxID=631119 RepID=UPI0020109601|nr:amino acid ABC transporter permease [Frankia sp. AgB32]MCK9898174.1 amino acid ABC transporter permease [Frankia sp. AgB32]